MNKFSIRIENIQHIKKLEYTIHLNEYGINAIVGKNGVGKTILFKSIQNLLSGTTFSTTSNSSIYNSKSQIIYDIDNKKYTFTLNSRLNILDIKDSIDSSLIEQIYVELSIPFGERFRQFQKLGQIDKDIKTSIPTQRYITPQNLINLLNYIYNTNRFDNLREITVKKEKYYFIELDNNLYIREDYLSSGEYFIINIFKLINKGAKFIAIDEIDISLDSMAQVRFISKLREISQEKEIKILFSTHSLALIKTLEKKELIYMDLEEGIASFKIKSYNYIKSLLFGFIGFDRYILVEDAVLKDYINYILRDENILNKFIIIPIAGATNTVTLMDYNKNKTFFNTSKENVITVLDGDYREKSAYIHRKDIIFLPFDSVEKKFFNYYEDGNLSSYYRSKEELKQVCNIQTISNKTIYNGFIRGNIMSQYDIFKFLSDKNTEQVNIFKKSIISFLK